MCSRRRPRNSLSTVSTGSVEGDLLAQPRRGPQLRGEYAAGLVSFLLIPTVVLTHTEWNTGHVIVSLLLFAKAQYDRLVHWRMRLFRAGNTG